MELKTMQCPNCGAAIEREKGKKYAVCEFCDAKVYFDFAPGEKDWDEEPAAAKTVNGSPKAAPEKERINLRTGTDGVKKGEEKTLDFKKIRKTWLIGLGVLFVFGCIFNSGLWTELFAAWLIYGGIFTLIVKAVFKRREKKYGPADPERGFHAGEPLDNDDLPWAIRVWGIIILGFFTGGIHWIVGPILRVYIKKNYCRR